MYGRPSRFQLTGFDAVSEAVLEKVSVSFGLFLNDWVSVVTVVRAALRRAWPGTAGFSVFHWL